MPILGLIVLILAICLVIYLLNLAVPGFLTPEANRLIWMIVTIVVVVCLLMFILSILGVSLGGVRNWNWGPRIG